MHSVRDPYSSNPAIKMGKNPIRSYKIKLSRRFTSLYSNPQPQTGHVQANSRMLKRVSVNYKRDPTLMYHFLHVSAQDKVASQPIQPIPSTKKAATIVTFPINVNLHGASKHFLPASMYIEIPTISVDNALRFGDRVQLCMDGLPVSFDMWTTTFVPRYLPGSSQFGVEEYEVFVPQHNKESLSSSSKPTIPLARSVFEIVRCDDQEYVDDFIRPDTRFQIVTPKGMFDNQYAIKTEPTHIANLSHSNYASVILSRDIKSNNSVWQCVSRSHKMIAWEAQQTLISYGSPISIRNASTNRLLCINTVSRTFLFGKANAVATALPVAKKSKDFEWTIVRV
ncbi:hypothetical protein RTP6_005003 [Batrachochytrium dendrobatidis]